jgi:predicted nuclease of predicted toxin-antitoxin system
MTLRIVVDMNLSSEWVDLLEEAGWSAVHWSTVSDPRADDAAIMRWALTNEHLVFTHDLDFGTALALTHAAGPSVIQVRGPLVLPEHIGRLVLGALRQYEADLLAGALIVLERTKTRARILPL